MRFLKFLAVAAVIVLAVSSVAVAGTRTMQQDRLKDKDCTAQGTCVPAAALCDQTQARSRARVQDTTTTAAGTAKQARVRQRDCSGDCDQTKDCAQAQDRTLARDCDGTCDGTGSRGANAGGKGKRGG
jgi:short subunit dehydrogenase-like uncharacterized protein